jgi:DNA-directed RNA polymerase specialized sigma24 family protein
MSPVAQPDTGTEHMLAQLDLAALVACCERERRQYHEEQPTDNRFAYELFRRALVERDEAAWEQVYTSYRFMVEHWVQRSSAFASSSESSDFFVNAAFTRFWQAITPARFAGFATLAGLLAYLQRCARCVVIDYVRSHKHAELPVEAAVVEDYGPQQHPDEEAVQRVGRAEFWRFISAQLTSEAERVVLFSSFLAGLKSREIYRQHQDLFSSVDDVYSIKRNVLLRLGNSRHLRHFLQA